MSHHLKQKFSVELKVRRCQTLFHELGFRRRKPRPMIAKADQEAQEAYKKLKELAKRDDIDVWFMDECHFQQQGSHLAAWFLKDEKHPIVIHAHTRNKLGLFGGIFREIRKFT